jgi:hypothetical protein
MNDYYLRQPYQQQFNFPPPQQPQIRANWVSSVEEARASQIDFLSTNLFCDTANGKIYLKKIGDNGKPLFLTYVIEEEVKPTDTLSEINSRLMNIENYLGGGRRNESVSNDVGYAKSEPVPYSTTAKPNESNDETKSTSFPKDAGNDKWKNRR